MKLKVNKSQAAIAESSGGSYIASSGIYDVVIKFASVDVSKNGAEQVNFNIEYNGNSQTIYGPWVTSKSGEPVEIGMKLINKLAIIADLQEGQELSIEEETHNVGKDNKPKEFAVITDFSDLPVKIRLQEEYNINPNDQEIRKSLVPKSFFREDGASAEEISNDGEIGKRLALETEKYASNVTYRDNLTASDVEAWKEAKKSGGDAPRAAATPKPKANATSGTLFV